MPLFSVPAIYDGKEIKLEEHSPVEGPYHVLVTFVRPAIEREDDVRRFWDSFGAWQDERPPETILQEIYQARRSKREPLSL